MNYDEKCQLLVLGDSAVGKSSLLQKYVNKEYEEAYSETVGIDLLEKDVLYGDNKVIRVKMWDTVGHDRYKSLIQCYLNQADGIVLVYDVNDQSSFYSLSNWLLILHPIVKQSKIKLLLLGNKLDLPRSVIKDIAERFAQENDFIYHEVSAKTGESITISMDQLIGEIIAEKEKCYDKKTRSFDPKRRLSNLLATKRKGKKSSCICN